MTEAELRSQVLEALREVAPDVDPATLDPDTPLRVQADIDSYDYLSFLLGIHERIGVDVPERDYPKVQSLNALLGYLLRSTTSR